MNRRHFLKGAGTALLGVAAAGVALARPFDKSKDPRVEYAVRRDENGWGRIYYRIGPQDTWKSVNPPKTS